LQFPDTLVTLGEGRFGVFVMDKRYAYITQGKLFIKEPGVAAPRQFESPFGKTLQVQKEETHRKRNWQKKSMIGGMVPPEMLERAMGQEPQQLAVTINSICPGENGQAYFTLAAGNVGGYLNLDLERSLERRLFHTADFGLDHLSYSSRWNMVACTLTRPDGSFHIGVMPCEGRRPDEVTEGDSMDLAPRWVPGEKKALVFQSAGLARDARGFIRDRAAFMVERLELDSAEITTLAADPAYDFIAPQLAADGTLYCIRRPRKKEAVPIWRMILGIMAIPFIFLYAIFQWCNFFSWRYTGKQLTTAGAETKRDLPPEQLSAFGEILTPASMPRGRHKQLAKGEVGWVPNSWQLVRRETDGKFTSLVQGVLAFDLGADGSIIYTDGTRIAVRSSEGASENLHRDAAVQWVSFV